MRSGNDIFDSIVEKTFYVLFNTTIICMVLLFLLCGFGIITIVSNLLAEIITVTGQRLAAWIMNKKSINSEVVTKNTKESSLRERENMQQNNMLTFNRTPPNMETIRLDSSTDEEFFSLDGNGFENQTSLNNSLNDNDTLNFSQNVNCHSTPSVKCINNSDVFSSPICIRKPKFLA
uniref:Uncharacterized protein n=1 Tax=Strongyloides venezuelensis TaxID=75913 RepID=A0A0K0FY06_STRVS